MMRIQAPARAHHSRSSSDMSRLARPMKTVICRNSKTSDVGRSMTTNTCGSWLRERGEEVMRPRGHQAAHEAGRCRRDPGPRTPPAIAERAADDPGHDHGCDRDQKLDAERHVVSEVPRPEAVHREQEQHQKNGRQKPDRRSSWSPLRDGRGSAAAPRRRSCAMAIRTTIGIQSWRYHQSSVARLTSSGCDGSPSRPR